MFNKISTTTMMAAMAAALLATAAPAAADDDNDGYRGNGRHWMMGWGQNRGNGRMMRGEGQQMGRFAIIDANDDGVISPDEAAAQRESVYLAMDSDDDGFLTEEEYMAVRMGPQEGRNEERMKARQEQKKARYAPMDTDKDGEVTPWEFRSQHRG